MKWTFRRRRTTKVQAVQTIPSSTLIVKMKMMPICSQRTTRELLRRGEDQAMSTLLRLQSALHVMRDDATGRRNRWRQRRVQSFLISRRLNGTRISLVVPRGFVLFLSWFMYLKASS